MTGQRRVLIDGWDVMPDEQSDWNQTGTRLEPDWNQTGTPNVARFERSENQAE